MKAEEKRGHSEEEEENAQALGTLGRRPGGGKTC